MVIFVNLTKFSCKIHVFMLNNSLRVPVRPGTCTAPASTHSDHHDMASIRRRGGFDMREILPRPRREFSTWLGRQATARENNRNSSCRGSCVIIVPRAVRLICSGIPLSLIRDTGHRINPGYIIRERGIPERINRTALGAMMARDALHDGFRLLLLLARRPPLS